MDLVLESSKDRLQDDALEAGERYRPHMNTAAVSLPQRLRLLPRRALLLPVVLAGLVQIDIWGGPLALGHMVGPRPVISLLYAVTSLSLIWCRRAPLAVLAFIVTADSAVYLVFGAPEGLGSFLPVLFAFSAVGRYSEPGNVVFAAPLTFAGIAIHELTDPVFSFGGSDAVFYAVLATGWPLGYAFRRRAMETQELVEAHVQTARAAVTAERARIARELHDVVGHGLSVIVLQLVAALSLLGDAEQSPLGARLLSAERSARDALAEMRRLLDLIDDGTSASLAPQPGLAQLDHLVKDTRAAGAEIELAIRGVPTDLPAGVDLAAFRILQESLTNVLKHARPPKAAVSVDYSTDAVIVEVIDQGSSDAEANSSGRGLAGMRERVALYGGDLDLGARREGGFLVRARLPLRP